MENCLPLLMLFLLSLGLLRLILLPVKPLCKLAAHSACGFACLWLLNLTTPVTGFLFPMNAVTVLTAGTLGLPGIAVLTLLELI